ncbi:MAG TPA: sugar phosphate isomerase/epimerase family protein [Chloroflexota bacterium]|nr:sugar phosphate isomerase/epimerase family protein [Chloroflexota bacterium]
MFKNLSPGAIGLRGLPLAESLALAREVGFAGIDFDIREAAELADAQGVKHVRDLFASAGVRPGQWGLPVAWRQDDKWPADLAELPRLAELGRTLGCTRTCTFMPPGSSERPYEENFAWHVERFRPIAGVLREQGCRLGIEFIGPKTSRADHAHEFIHDLGGLMELAGAIGTGNVGVLLDAWHLYTSGGAVEDLDRITAQDVVAVHVNDAPAGIARDDQIDNVRALPMETGVIDLPGFMGKLRAMGYDGPVTAEPFSKRLAELAASDRRAAVAQTARSMDALWRAAALS